MSNSLIVPCLNCKTPVELKQPRGGDAFPYGKCSKCGLYHYAVYESNGDIRVSSFKEEEHA